VVRAVSEAQCNAELYAEYIGALARCEGGSLAAVEAVHERVRRREIPVSSWTYARLIDGYRSLKREDKALGAFDEATASGVPMSSGTF